MSGQNMDTIEQRRIGREVARALGLPSTNYSLLETIGAKVQEIRKDNGQTVIILKSQTH